MKKETFYTLARDPATGSVKAILRSGYTDGAFNYYKMNSKWFAIVPQYGLALATAYTRKEAVRIAFNNLDRLKEYDKTNGESMRNLFLEKARRAATI